MSDPKYIHAMEQLAAMLRDLPSAVAAYYHGLIEEGMDEEEAMELTIAMQEALLRGEDDGG